MTDPTVDPGYYCDPTLYLCERCGAVWRWGFNPSVDAVEVNDELDYMGECRDSHRCIPGVTRDAAEALRGLAVVAAAGVYRQVPSWGTVDELTDVFGSTALAEMLSADSRMIDAATDRLLALADPVDLDVLTTATPMVKFVSPHTWEHLLAVAAIRVRRESGRWAR